MNNNNNNRSLLEEIDNLKNETTVDNNNRTLKKKLLTKCPLHTDENNKLPAKKEIIENTNNIPNHIVAQLSTCSSTSEEGNNNELLFNTKYNNNPSTFLDKFKQWCRTNIKNTTQFKRFLQQYCEYLYKYLKDTDTCFVKGSFVIDDKQGFMKYLLQNTKKKIKKVYGSTHDMFGPSKTKQICDADSGICEIHLKTFSVTAECPKSVEMGIQNKTNIKFYFFNNLYNGDEEPDRFMFFKLERFDTYSVKHSLAAMRRYSKQYNTIEHHRREDCVIEENCKCANLEIDCPHKYLHDPHASKKLYDSKCHLNYDQHKRIGDEYFINSYINEEIFKQIVDPVPEEQFVFQPCDTSLAGGSNKKFNQTTKKAKKQALKRNKTRKSKK
jgi:hypothetical protein